jgi:hypothetical protein
MSTFFSLLHPTQTHSELKFVPVNEKNPHPQHLSQSTAWTRVHLWPKVEFSFDIMSRTASTSVTVSTSRAGITALTCCNSGILISVSLYYD